MHFYLLELSLAIVCDYTLPTNQYRFISQSIDSLHFMLFHLICSSYIKSTHAADKNKWYLKHNTCDYDQYITYTGTYILPVTVNFGRVTPRILTLVGRRTFAF